MQYLPFSSLPRSVLIESEKICAASVTHSVRGSGKLASMILVRLAVVLSLLCTLASLATLMVEGGKGFCCDFALKFGSRGRVHFARKHASIAVALERL